MSATGDLSCGIPRDPEDSEGEHCQMSTWSGQLSEVDPPQIAYLAPLISNVRLLWAFL